MYLGASWRYLSEFPYFYVVDFNLVTHAYVVFVDAVNINWGLLDFYQEENAISASLGYQ